MTDSSVQFPNSKQHCWTNVDNSHLPLSIFIIICLKQSFFHDPILGQLRVHTTTERKLCSSCWRLWTLPCSCHQI